MSTPEEQRCAAIGARLRSARKERAKLTAVEASRLMRAAGIMCSVRTLRRWETGEHLPKTWDLPTIAEKYGVTVGYFFKT